MNAISERFIDDLLSHYNLHHVSTVTVSMPCSIAKVKYAMRDGVFTGEYVDGTNVQWLNDWLPMSIIDKTIDLWGIDLSNGFKISTGAAFLRAADLGLTAFESGYSDTEKPKPEPELLKYTGTDHVYFVLSKTLNRVKIGTSSDVASRFSALKTSSPDELEILGVIPGDCVIERSLHKRFAHSRLHGEWFDLSDDLSTYIKEETNQ